MRVFTYDTEPNPRPRLGLIALQTDERIEPDFRRLFPTRTDLFVTRVPSGLDVTPESLQRMEAHIGEVARLLPDAQAYDAVGYGCTSGTAQIGADRIADLVRAGCPAKEVSEPLSALIAACRAMGLTRLAFLSPYMERVSDRLRGVLSEHGIQTPIFGSFDEALEARVVRITPASIHRAACSLVAEGDVQAVFLSCTNLNTLDVIETIETETGLPVLSSNQVLAWHLSQLSGIQARIPGRLGR